LVFKRLQKKEGGSHKKSRFGPNASKIDKSAVSGSKISGLDEMYIGESKHIGGISNLAGDVPEDPNEQSYAPDSAKASFTKPDNSKPNHEPINLP
jgi:hypothetical protein